MLRFVLLLATVVAWAASSSWVALAAGSDTIGVYGNVTTVPADGLIQHPGNLFDLEEKTLTLAPRGAGGYYVAVRNLDWRDPAPGEEAVSRELRARANGYLTVELPFRFPFAGQSWTQVYANASGNLSFQRPERMNQPQRNHNAMLSVAAAMDARSALGLETMIAVLWAEYQDTTITVASNPGEVVITWRTVRRSPHNEHGYTPLGQNLFQARLYPSGVVELAYRAVPERDGIVGLFYRSDASGNTLDTFDDAHEDVAHGVLDIARIEWVDHGSVMLFRMTLAEAVPEQVHAGTIDYRAFLDLGDSKCLAGINVTTSGRRAFGECYGSRGSGSYRVDGRTIEIPISKTFLSGLGDHFSWSADAVWWGLGEFDQVFGTSTVAVNDPSGDLSALTSAVAGNAREVFHYPSLKSTQAVISHIYERAPANDQILVPFTDFRMDSFGNAGAGTGPINDPVQGIGEWQANPTRGTTYGSDTLLVSMRPAFIGTPAFAYTNSSGGYALHNFAPGVGWIAHEAVHRWAAHLQFRNPQSGRIESLADEGCRCHWSRWLHQPVVYPVWAGYSNEPYPEASLMGNRLWADNGDGTFTETPLDIWPSGLSALDLYAMGVLPATEVPETFLLTDVQETGTRRTVRATKVPVRIQDIVAAMGARVPEADVAQREFEIGIYLLHRGDRPPHSELLQRAQDIIPAVSEYFRRATGGRMQVIPTRNPD